MKERQIDRGIRSWAARLANRRDTKRIVVWILAVAVLAAFALVALGALFGIALAVRPITASAHRPSAGRARSSRSSSSSRCATDGSGTG